jgi:hypothetical protein
MEQADIDEQRYIRIIFTGFLSFMILIFVFIMVHSHYEIADMYENCELKKGYITKIYKCTTCENDAYFTYDINFTNNIGRKKVSGEDATYLKYYVGDSIPILYDKRNDNIHIYYKDRTKIKSQLENVLSFLFILSIASLMLYFFRKMEIVSADSEED